MQIRLVLKTKLSKTDALLLRTFTFLRKDTGAREYSGGTVDTDEGTAAQWRYLEQAGFAEKATRSGRGILGHHFSRRATAAGVARIAELLT